MAVRLLLIVRDNCPECDEAKSALSKYINSGEIDVVDINEASTKYNLGVASYTPSVCVLSETSKSCINGVIICDPSKECNPKLVDIGFRLVRNWMKKFQ